MSERILVGSRAGFGVEIAVRSLVGGVWADVFWWIGGESLGREENAIALYALLGTLDGLLIQASRNSIASGVSSFQASALWDDFETVGRKYSLDSSEFFDRYEMYCVSDEQFARFLWKDRYLELPVLHDVSVPLGEVLRSLKDPHVVHERLSRES